MTTAQLRTAALEAASNLLWAEAASLMRRAIDAHPGDPRSGLVKRELAGMENKAQAWEAEAWAAK